MWLAKQTAPSEQAVAWFYLDPEGERQGPCAMQELVELLAQGLLSQEAAVWSKAIGEWQMISAVPVLQAALSTQIL